MKRVIAAVALLGVLGSLGGCGTGRAAYKSRVMQGTEVAKAFDAARAVVKRQGFRIASADARAGTIDSAYLLSEAKADLGRLPRALGNLDRAEEEMNTHRRAVRVMVRGQGADAVVSVRVAKERQDKEIDRLPPPPTEHYDPVGAPPTSATVLYDESGRATEGDWRQTRTLWTPVGSDERLERLLLDEIARALGVKTPAE